MKAHFYLLLLLPLLSGCGLFSDDNDYSVTGTLYHDCNRVPESNKVLELTNKGTVVATTTTNADGTFALTYKGKDTKRVDDGLTLRFRVNDQMFGATVLEAIPADENLALGELFTNDIAKLKITLAAQNSYSANDTIFYVIGSAQAGERQLIGPFESLIIDTISFNKLYLATPRYNLKPQAQLIWGRGRQAFKQAAIIAGGTNPSPNVLEFTASGCNKFDEVTINLP